MVWFLNSSSHYCLKEKAECQRSEQSRQLEASAGPTKTKKKARMWLWQPSLTVTNSLHPPQHQTHASGNCVWMSWSFLCTAPAGIFTVSQCMLLNIKLPRLYIISRLHPFPQSLFDLQSFLVKRYLWLLRSSIWAHLWTEWQNVEVIQWQFVTHPHFPSFPNVVKTFLASD